MYYDSLPKSYQYLATYICLCHLIRQLITMKSNVSATLALYLCICQPVCPHLSLFVCLCLQLWRCICVGVCLQSASCCSTALLTVSSSVEQVCLKRLTPLISSNHNNLPSGISINHITLVGCCLASWHSALQKQGNVKITIIASALCNIRCQLFSC